VRRLLLWLLLLLRLKNVLLWLILLSWIGGLLSALTLLLLLLGGRHSDLRICGLLNLIGLRGLLLL
jgi:hypothetical protein